MKPNFESPLFGVIISSFIAGFSSGCNRAGAQPQKQPAPSVTVAPVEQKEIVEWNEFTGHTEPVQSVEVRPRVSGKNWRTSRGWKRAMTMAKWCLWVPWSKSPQRAVRIA